jgi:4'-phosphopantetheinyl transferase
VWWLTRGVRCLPDRSDWLSPAEAERSAALRFAKRRTEYLLRRLAAKHAVTAVLGRPTDPAALARIEVGNEPSGLPPPRRGRLGGRAPGR